MKVIYLKILVVEDDDNKAKQISQFLNAIIEDLNLTIKKSFQSGMEAIINNLFDLVLLDMSMPTFEASPSKPKGRHRHYAGKDILTEMKREGVSIPTIVVTQFGVFGEGSDTMNSEQLDINLKGEFPEMYLGMVHYNTSVSDWRKSLEEFLKRNFSI